jgi:diguanylate cyclase (GGDEF)-like protein
VTGPDASLALLSAVVAVALAGGWLVLRRTVRRRRREQELVRTTGEVRMLREISVAFSALGSDEEAFGRLYGTLRSGFPVRALAAVSYDEDPEGFPTVTIAGEVSLQRAAFQDWLTGHRDLEVPFLPAAPAPRVSLARERELALNPEFPVQVLLPLQTPAVIAGLLVLESDDPKLATPGALQELSVVADHVAIALQDRNLRRQMQLVNERLQSRADTLHRILELSNELKAHLTLAHVTEAVVRAVRQNLGFAAATLFLYDRNANVFEKKAETWGTPKPEETVRVPREEIACWFSERYRISKSYFVSHLDRSGAPEITGRIVRQRRTPGPGSWHRGDRLYIPLTAGDQLVGVLFVEDPATGQVPTLADVQALEIFANHAVSAIQSARAYEATQELSVRDALTEAFNHRYFQEALAKELTRHERTGHPFTLGMLDIDDFKKINDLFGHPVGDVVLRGLVEEMTRSVREMDTVARYGGEEFALIFPETASEQALLVSDRLRRRVAASLFSVPGLSHPLGITVSIGLASFPDDALTKRTLVERADQALYQAKRSGKNCLVTASSLADLKTF